MNPTASFVRIIGCAALASIASTAHASDAWLVSLSEEPLACAAGGAGGEGTTDLAGAISYKQASIRAAQADVATMLAKSFPQVKVVRRVENLFSGLVVLGADDAAIAALKSSPLVADVAKVPEVELQLAESVPSVGASAVHDMVDGFGDEITGLGVRIAVLDSGIDVTHPDLGDGCDFSQGDVGCPVAGGYDFCDSDEGPGENVRDYLFDGHGTHVASIAGGASGVAPGSELFSYRVTTPLSSQLCDGAEWEGSFAAVVDTLERELFEYDASTGEYVPVVDIVNMSFETSQGSDAFDAFFEQAIECATDQGILFVGAAGNNRYSYTQVASPANFDSVLAVGAIDHRDDTLMDGTARGPYFAADGVRMKPDLVAPGVEICAALARPSFWANNLDPSWIPGCGDMVEEGGELVYRDAAVTGTSMATPHVAGAAALLKQVRPDLNARDLKAVLSQSAVPMSFDVATVGHGKLDVERALFHPALLDLDSHGVELGIDEAITLSHRHLGDGPIGLRIEGLSWQYQAPGDDSVPDDPRTGEFGLTSAVDVCLSPDGSVSSAAPVVVEGASFEITSHFLTPAAGDYFTKLSYRYFDDCSFSGEGQAYTIPLVVSDARDRPVGDLTGDGVVNATDLGHLLGSWGSPNSFADLDGSGSVGPEDLGMLLSAWT